VGEGHRRRRWPAHVCPVATWGGRLVGAGADGACEKPPEYPDDPEEDPELAKPEDPPAALDDGVFCEGLCEGLCDGAAVVGGLAVGVVPVDPAEGAEVPGVTGDPEDPGVAPEFWFGTWAVATWCAGVSRAASPMRTTTAALAPAAIQVVTRRTPEAARSRWAWGWRWVDPGGGSALKLTYRCNQRGVRTV